MVVAVMMMFMGAKTILILFRFHCLLINGYVAGLFMALQPRIIACGNSVAAFTMGVRFLTGPAVMAAASIIVGLRGVLLHVAIVQVPATFFSFFSRIFSPKIMS